MTAYQRKDGTGGCYSTEPSDRRVKSDTMLMPDGWREMQRGEIVTREPVMAPVTTPWVNTDCMRLEQAGYRDANCVGCVHDV